jgi:hypothetical protein
MVMARREFVSSANRHQQLDRSGLARRAADESELLELEDHRVHAGRRHAEEALEVGFRGRLAVEQDLRVDERQVLALLVGESALGPAGHGSDEVIQGCDLVDLHYQTFEPPEARRILSRLEFHFTPKHASWLNMVEIEIGVMVAQCLDRRIGDKATLIAEIATWERRRNAERARLRWMFTVDRAREKMGRAYPRPAYGPAKAAA